MPCARPWTQWALTGIEWPQLDVTETDHLSIQAAHPARRRNTGIRQPFSLGQTRPQAQTTDHKLSQQSVNKVFSILFPPRCSHTHTHTHTRPSAPCELMRTLTNEEACGSRKLATSVTFTKGCLFGTTLLILSQQKGKKQPDLAGRISSDDHSRSRL